MVSSNRNCNQTVTLIPYTERLEKVYTKAPMSAQIIDQYEWQGQSPIRKMDVERMPSGQMRVRLYPNENTRHSLAQLPEKLKQSKLGNVYPDVYQGQNVLMIGEVTSPQSVLVSLQEMGVLDGAAHFTHFADAAQEVKQSFVDKVKMNSMNLSGFMGMPGHVALAASGLMMKDYSLVWAAPKSLCVPLILTAYGTGKGELKFEQMLTRMNEYFADGGIKLPPPGDKQQQGGILRASQYYLEKYPLQIAFTMGAWGAFDWLMSAMRELKGTQFKSGYGKLAMAGGALASDLAALLLPEAKKKPQPVHEREIKDYINGQHVGENPFAGEHVAAATGTEPVAANDNQQQSTLSSFKDKLIGSPLLMKGLFESVNNIGTFINAFEQKKRVKRWQTPEYATEIEKTRNELQTMQQSGNVTVETSKQILAKDTQLSTMIRQRELALNPMKAKVYPILGFAVALSFTVSAALSAISSKNRNPAYLVPEAYEPLYATCSRMLMDIPKDDRPEVLELMANYLGTEHDVRDGNIDVRTIKREIGQRLEVMETSPFIAHQAMGVEHAQAAAAR